MKIIEVEEDLVRKDPEKLYRDILNSKDTKAFTVSTADPSRFLDYAEKLKNEGIKITYKIRLSPCQDWIIPPKDCPNLPKFESRIEQFKQLAKLVGKENIIWVFAPTILCSNTEIKTEQDLARAFISLQRQLEGCYSEVELWLLSEIDKRIIADDNRNCAL